MKLELCGELMETPIDKEYIENAINSLVEDDFFKSFMVLSKDDYCFMQIIRLPSPANTFVLEFKEGADGILYTCISEHLNTKQVIEAFQNYFEGNDNWKSELVWEKENIGDAGLRTILIQLEAESKRLDSLKQVKTKLLETNAELYLNDKRCLESFYTTGKIRKISNSICVLDGYSIGWKLSLNAVLLPLKNINIISIFKAHDNETNTEVSQNEILTAVVDLDVMKDFIFIAKDDEEDESLLTLEPIKSIHVTIKELDSLEANKENNRKVRCCNVTSLGFMCNEGGLNVELELPSEQLQLIVTGIKSNSGAHIHIVLNLESFILLSKWEIQDPTCLFISDETEVFLSSISVSTKIGIHTNEVTDSVKNNELNNKKTEEYKDVSTEQIIHQQLMKVLESSLLSSKSLVFAIWFLIAVIAISIFILSQ